jgi:hypothetical protein
LYPAISIVAEVHPFLASANSDRGFAPYYFHDATIIRGGILLKQRRWQKLRSNKRKTNVKLGCTRSGNMVKLCSSIFGHQYYDCDVAIYILPFGLWFLSNLSWVLSIVIQGVTYKLCLHNA